MRTVYLTLYILFSYAELFGQLSPAKVMRLSGNDIPFGRALPEGSLLVNLEVDSCYILLQAVDASQTFTDLLTGTDIRAIDADGAQGMDNEVVWDDLFVFPDAISKRGLNPPGEMIFKNDGGSSPGVYLDAFPANTVREVFFTVQLPHTYKEGSDLFPHVHWTSFDGQGIPNGSDVTWGLEYSIVSPGDPFGNTNTIKGSSVIMEINTVAGSGQHLINSLDTIQGDGLQISTVIVCRLFRDTEDSSDTFSGSAGFLGIDFHFQKDAQGSRLPFSK